MWIHALSERDFAKVPNIVQVSKCVFCEKKCFLSMNFAFLQRQLWVGKTHLKCVSAFLNSNTSPHSGPIPFCSFPGSFKPFLSIDIWEHFTFLFWHLGTAVCFLCTLCSFRRSSPQLSDLSSEDLPNFSNTPSKALPLFIFLKSRYPVTFLSYCTFIWQ